MVCPLRYVLVAVSALLALAFALRDFWYPTPDSEKPFEKKPQKVWDPQHAHFLAQYIVSCSLCRRCCTVTGTPFAILILYAGPSTCIQPSLGTCAQPIFSSVLADVIVIWQSLENNATNWLSPCREYWGPCWTCWADGIYGMRCRAQEAHQNACTMRADLQKFSLQPVRKLLWVKFVRLNSVMHCTLRQIMNADQDFWTKRKFRPFTMREPLQWEAIWLGKRNY